MLDHLQLQPIQPQDAYFMELALAQAKKGIFTTRPNPAVGCVIVKNGQIIGAGFHPKAGEPHAEIFALKDTYEQGQDVLGATVYVTLEPCSHTGRTPPCSDALIKANVQRVVVACLDSNPQVAGRGVLKLIQAGIDVSVGVCESQAKKLNVGFFKAMTTGLPYVRLKVACSLDGRTAMQSGESKWITGTEARKDVQKLRARSGAIITGSGTIIADNPALSVRSTTLGIDNNQVPAPKIVVVDRQQQLAYSDDYQVFARQGTLLWHQDLLSLLKTLVAEHQCYDVLVEAGAKLSGAFIANGLVDELIVYQAPCVLGATAQPLFDISIEQLALQKRFDLLDLCQIGNDLKLVFIPK